MPLHSMTGFAREVGGYSAWRWVWELRSVNGRGLDVKIKLPPGFDAMAEGLRRAASAKLQRGTVFAALSAQRDVDTVAARIDEPLLDRLIEVAKRAASRHALPPPSIEALFAVRGVVDMADAGESDEEREATALAFAAGFSQALDALSVARRDEGRRLEGILEEQLAKIERLTQAAEACPARQPPAVRERLAKQLGELLNASDGFDPVRLHQEAALIATRADVREEIDRLRAHAASARELLANGGAVGRRLDFLAQEFGREANTLTAKANDAALSRIGLELKTVVEQWREQVQNVE
jgi:uncharacterized protein (TIGR00255 family)